MKYRTSRQVKQALLNGVEVKINKWSALINRKDEIEIWDPKGKGVVASMIHLDRAVKDFYRVAQGIPEKMPKPVTYESTPSGSGPLGDDTSQDKPWTDPKVNKQPVMQGPTSDPDLKDDTSQDPPWTDPEVNTRPMPDKGRGGLPDTDLGKDTQKNDVEWEDKLTGPEVFRMARNRNRRAENEGFTTQPDIEPPEDWIIEGLRYAMDIPEVAKVYEAWSAGQTVPLAPDLEDAIFELEKSVERMSDKESIVEVTRVVDALDEIANEAVKLVKTDFYEEFPSDVKIYGKRRRRSQDMDPGDSGKEEMGTTDPDTEFHPEIEYEPHQIENKGEAPSNLPNDLGGRSNARRRALFGDPPEREAVASLVWDALDKYNEVWSGPEFFSPWYMDEYEENVNNWIDQITEALHSNSMDTIDTENYINEIAEIIAKNADILDLNYSKDQIHNELREIEGKALNKIDGRSNARRKAQQSSVGDFIWEKLSIFDEWWETDAGDFYARDFKSYVSSWIDAIEEAVRWAEESGTGDVTQIDYDDYPAQLSSILFKLGPEGVSRDDFRFQLEEIQNEAIDLAWKQYERQASRRGFVDTFDREATPKVSYQDLVNASPSRDLLTNIADPEKWAATQVVKSFASGMGRGLYKDPEGKRDKANKGMTNMQGKDPDEVEAGCDYPEKKKKSRRKRSIHIPMDEVDFKVITEPDDMSPGESFDMDDAEVEAIYRELEMGNLWAWTMVKVTAAWSPQPGKADYIIGESDWLGGVSVESEEDFVVGESDYYEDLKDQAYEDLLIKVEDADIGMRGIRPNRESRRRKAGPKLKENWTTDGGYTRDIEAETPEELYHLTRSFGSDDDYDWSSVRPQQQVAEEAVEDPGNGIPMEAKKKAQEVDTYPSYIDEEGDVVYKLPYEFNTIEELIEIAEQDEVLDSFLYGDLSTNEGVENQSGSTIFWGSDVMAFLPKIERPSIASRKALDDTGKSYWRDYFGDYGEDLVKDDSTKKNRKELEPKVDETPKPAGQQKVKSRRRTRGQAAPAAPPEAAPPGGQMTDPETAPQTPAQGPAAPAAPAKPEKAPGAGDEGLKALGWTPDEIKLMNDEDKQKILQVQLKKPGTGAAQAPTGQPAQKPPAKPVPEAPQAGPAPMPAQPEQGMPAPTARRLKRQSAEKLKIAKAFRRLAQAAPVQTGQTPPAPQTSPGQPVTAPGAPAPSAPAEPAEPAVADEFAGETSTEFTPETEAMSIYNEILQKEVKASSPEQVPALKSQELVQRLLTEVGMPMTEARQLFGLKSGDGFNKLFQ